MIESGTGIATGMMTETGTDATEAGIHIPDRLHTMVLLVAIAVTADIPTAKNSAGLVTDWIAGKRIFATVGHPIRTTRSISETAMRPIARDSVADTSRAIGNMVAPPGAGSRKAN
jgi:hypothetical protein